MGAQFAEEEIPEKYRAQAKAYREKMIEAICEQDEALLEKYVHGEQLAVQELKNQPAPLHDRDEAGAGGLRVGL